MTAEQNNATLTERRHNNPLAIEIAAAG